MADPPSKLDLSFDVPFGSSFTATVEDGVLKVRSHSASSSVRPSADDWDELLNLLREIGADDWEWRYSSSRLLTDCASWSVRIEANGISVFSGGYDAFPPEGGLQRLLDYISSLAGLKLEG